MSDLKEKLIDLFVEAVDCLERAGIQPTARQVSRAFGQGELFAKRALLQAVELGRLTVTVERIERAKGDFSVYRPIPAVRVRP
jgi:hypothetical protein